MCNRSPGNPPGRNSQIKPGHRPRAGTGEQRRHHAAQGERIIVLIGVSKSLPTQNDKSAPDSFESWDAYRTALPRSLLLNSLTFHVVYVNGTDGLLVEQAFADRKCGKWLSSHVAKICTYLVGG